MNGRAKDTGDGDLQLNHKSRNSQLPASSNLYFNSFTWVECTKKFRW